MGGTGDAPLMVGVSGLRGIVGQSLTPEVAARFAGAFAGWQRDRRGARAAAPGLRFVVGADGRAGYEPLRDAVVGALLEVGAEVYDADVCMTPTVAVIADHWDADGAIIITASHNPQQWNGLKCLVRDERGQEVVSAAAPGARAAGEIIERFRQGPAPVPERARGPAGHIHRVGDPGCHLGPVLSAVNEHPEPGPIRGRGYRVVLDSVNGAGRRAGGALLREGFGCDLLHLGNEDTGLFPHPPEPLREHLTGLCDAVRQHRADAGFAQDPDADRLAIVDERGEYIGEEYTLVFAAMALLSASEDGRDARPTTAGAADAERVICVNLSTSRMIDDVAARYGARVVRTAVGEANVVEAMKREAAAGHDVVLGGEGNGGVIWPRVTFVRDSLSAMALVLALMARTGKTVSQLVAEIPAYAIEKRKVDLARKEDATPAVEQLAAAYRGERIDRQDGIRIDFDDRRAWLHVRASNTEPIMRLIAEAPAADTARAILDEAARVIAG